jgi:hypothetical protein
MNVIDDPDLEDGLQLLHVVAAAEEGLVDHNLRTNAAHAVPQYHTHTTPYQVRSDKQAGIIVHEHTSLSVPGHASSAMPQDAYHDDQVGPKPVEVRPL